MPEMKVEVLTLQLISHTNFYLDQTDDEYLSLVGHSLGVSKNRVKALQKYIGQTRNERELEHNAKESIKQSLIELSAMKKENRKKSFLTQVLAPYLTITLKEIHLDQSIEERIFQEFEINFGNEKNSSPLKEIIDATKNYHRGESFNVDFLHAINQVFIWKGYYLDYNLESTANIFKIKDRIIDDLIWNDTTKISVLLLKRVIPGILDSKLGYSTIATKNVVVIEDPLNQIAEVYLQELKRINSLEKFNDLRFEKYWKKAGLSLSLDIADQIYKNLLTRDFAGKNKKEIIKALEMEIALHEAKHKADNYDAPHQTLNLDREFGAHVTAAIYSEAPFMALYSAIERIQNFYFHLNEERMQENTVALWEIARKALDSSYTKETLRHDLYILYTKYRTIRENEPLPLLGPYQEKIVSAIWEYYKKQ